MAPHELSRAPPEQCAEARALDASGRTEEAERAWTEIFRESPADAEAFARASALALARAGMDAWIDIAAEHEQAVAAVGDVERRRDLRYDRGRLFLEAGQLEARRRVPRVARARPGARPRSRRPDAARFLQDGGRRGGEARGGGRCGCGTLPSRRRFTCGSPGYC
jgi:hypothetical protein